MLLSSFWKLFWRTVARSWKCSRRATNLTGVMSSMFLPRTKSRTTKVTNLSVRQRAAKKMDRQRACVFDLCIDKTTKTEGKRKCSKSNRCLSLYWISIMGNLPEMKTKRVHWLRQRTWTLGWSWARLKLPSFEPAMWHQIFCVCL